MPRTPRPRSGRRPNIAPYLYLAPALVPMIVFMYWPMVFSLALSAMKWNFINPVKQFVGLANYTEMFQKELFWKSLVNTFSYAAIIVPAQIIVPLILALLLFSVYSNRFKSLYQTIIFMPTVLSFAIVCMIWLWMFNPSHGFLNHLLRVFGVPEVSWLSERQTALPAIALVTNWKLTGYNFIIFYAALTAISQEYVEAAVIDGAASRMIFWRIKFPLLSPTTFFVLVTTIIYSSDRVFIPINMLTRGGPYYSTTNLVFAIYRFSFQFFNVGVASAAATVTFLIFLLITYLQLRFLQKRVHYEA